MKYKDSELIEFLLDYGWVIIAAIIVIGVLAYFGVFNPEHYNQYTITQEKCWIETETIGEKLVGEPIITTYPYKMRTYSSTGEFQDRGVYEDFIQNQFPDCNSTYCEYNYWNRCNNYYCWGVQIKIWKENFIETYQHMEPIYDTRLICEQVEVDFMLLPDIDNCIGEKCPKKDLTQDWLDENCCCIIGIYKDIQGKLITQEENNTECDKIKNYQLKKCSKYKCGKDYFVEVVK